MAPVPTSLESADPEDLGRREFSKARKGWDILEVRAHMLGMASEIKRLRTLEKDLGARVRTLETSLRDQSDLDESKLAQMVGEETGRVLEAARTAATEIRQKAEDSAERLVREAQERAAELITEATEARDRALREADELADRARTTADEAVATAKNEAIATRDAAEAESRDTRATALALLGERTAEAEAAAVAVRTEAEELLEQARADADDARQAADDHASASAARAEAEAAVVVEAAREQSREMLTETKEARERMLADLSERRHSARQQLESLRAARERMLESFAAARETFDRSEDHLVEALPNARQAAEDAAAAVENDTDANELIAELGLSDPIIEQPRTSAAADLPEDGPAESIDNDETATIDGAVGDADAIVADGTKDPAAGDSDALAVSGTDDTASATTGSDEEPNASDEDSESASHLRLVSSGPGLTAVDDLDDDDDRDDDHDDDSHHDASVDPESGAADAIFARLRADVAPTAPDQHDGASEPGGASRSGGAVVIDLAPPAGLLDARDVAIGTLERSLGRRLKRAVSDHENVVLDRIRRHKKGPLELSVLGDADDLALALAVAALDDVTGAIIAGSQFLDDEDHGEDVDGGVIAELIVASMHGSIVEPLMARLSDTIAAHDVGAGSDDLIAICRSIYREAKGDSIVANAGDLVTSGFNRGIVESSCAGARHCWLVDNGGLPCPDAEDNSLSDPVVAGEEFPTGHVAPSAHPGCRCLLAPAPH